ncbi:MAG: STAS domain-containing protein [Roseiflexaceae bacterium]|nr:STAS domain-containing protein [Roseiflexaceae bacterium]
MTLQQLFVVSTNDPDIQRRGTVILNVSALLSVLLLLAVPASLTRANSLPSLIAVALGVLLVASAFWLARRGYVAVSGWLLVIMSAAVVVLPSLLRREVTDTLFYLSIPILIASVVLRPWQVWLALLVAYAAVAVNAALITTPLSSVTPTLQNLFLVLLMIAGIGFLSARLTKRAFDQDERAQQSVRSAARELEQANLRLESEVADRTRSLQQALADVQMRAAEQQRLLDELGEQRVVIREMSTPVLPLGAHTLVMPLIGGMDSGRLQHLREQALTAIEQRHARRLLLDITGVPIVDSQVAQGIISVVNAARLLGAQVTLVGVRPEVAQTIVGLGLDLSAVQTEQDLESAMAR